MSNPSLTDRRTHRSRSIGPLEGCHCQHCDRKRIANATITLSLDGDHGVVTATFGRHTRLWSVHPANRCAGRPCVIHNPTDHHMRSWALHWRDDRKLFERICPHGIGHPDPDQYYYWNETGQGWQGVHGCDGCCVSGRGTLADD